MASDGPAHIERLGDILLVHFGREDGVALHHDEVSGFFSDRFQPATANATGVIVDLEHIATLDSSALGPLVQRLHQLPPGRMILCCLRSTALREIFRLTHFDQVFPLVATRAEAIARLGVAGPTA